MNLLGCFAGGAAQGWVRGWGLLLGGLLLVPLISRAQPADSEGMLLTVPNPITQEAVQLIQTKVAYAVERQGRNLQVILFDFNPSGPAATRDYGPCLTLKNYIADLWHGRVKLAGRYQQINTIAYVHNVVRQHTLLPVLACTELVMSREGVLGEVLTEGEGPLPEEVKEAYRFLAKESRWGDLILRLLDKNLPVHRVRTQEGIAYWGPETLQQKQAAGEKYQLDANLPAGLAPGSAEFSAALLVQLGLAKEVPGDRLGVCEALGLSPASLREEWLPTPTRAYRIEVNGTLDAGRLASLQRRIQTALRQGANVLILQLACSGGNTVDMGSAAEFLRTLKGEDGPVMTIAYVPPGVSLGAGTFLALGCRQIVLAASAVLGDFESLQDLPEEQLQPKREMLVALARQQGYPPLLFQATLDRHLELYKGRTRSGRWQLLTAEEKAADDQKPPGQQRWQEKVRLPHAPGTFLKIDAALAKDLGVALWSDVESAEELNRRYDLHHVTVFRDDWLDRVAEFFREPVVNLLLLMIGMASLVLALKMPGLGVPEVLAGLCFVLFFWSHSFVGQFTMLAVLLFLLGLVLIGLEIFIMPGLGVTGISGVLLVVLSLVLVTLEHLPRTSEDWGQLALRLTTFLLSMLGALATAFLLAWYLPHIPYARRIILAPPGTPEEEEVEASEPPPTIALLGQVGEAVTPLRPAGKARFGEEFVDVVSEGDYIPPGSRVQVIEVEGNRVVVKACVQEEY
jgi:membrane-bound serine protease (ClpP class)